VGRALAGTAIFVAGAWSGLVLLFAPILLEDLRVPAAVFAAALLGAALLEFPRPRRWIAPAALFGLAAFTGLAWLRLTPSQEADWIPEVARQPSAVIAGDLVTIQNVRNFAWRTETDFEPHWEQRTYDLRQLRRVDLFASYWSGEDIAHVILSFGFEEGEHLATSIEIRRRIGQEYSPVAGFFRNYEIVYVLADERDLVRLRTNARGERVYLYRLRASPEAARRLFLEYLRDVNALVTEPRFYNTLLTNCTTQIRFSALAAGATLPWDWRLVLTGHTPEYLYDRGSVDVRLPFPELRDQAQINDAARAADTDALFARRIREGRPDPLL
jgi:Domain of unknown function (DUF4105)